jgi:hypothetical protein
VQGDSWVVEGEDEGGELSLGVEYGSHEDEFDPLTQVCNVSQHPRGILLWRYCRLPSSCAAKLGSHDKEAMEESFCMRGRERSRWDGTFISRL